MINGRNVIKKTTIASTTAFSIIIVMSTLSISSLTWQGQLAYAHHVIEQIPVGKGPMQMSLANNTLYVANVGQPLVNVIDTTTDKTIARINTTAGVSTLYAVPTLGKLYVSIFEQPRIEVYDLKTFNFIRNITLPGAILDYWYSPFDRNQTHVILGTGGSSMDYDPTTGMMYVAISNHDHMEVIDTKTDTAIKTINLPAHPSAVKVDPQSQMVLVTSTAGNRLSFISTKTNEVIGDIITGNAPWNLAIDPSTHMAYVTNMASYYVSAVYIPTRQIIANIPTTNFAQAIAIDSSEHKIYFSSIGAQSIVKVDGKSNQIETVIEMDAVPSYLLADSTTHRVYATVNLEPTDQVTVIGPQSVSTSLPVITLETPSAVVSTIKVHGQDVMPSEPYVNIANKTLTMPIKTQDGGNLTLELPRQLIDAKQGNIDSQFRITIDGKTSSYQEGQPITAPDGTQSRVISLFVPKGSANLEVAGTQSIVAGTQPIP